MNSLIVAFQFLTVFSFPWKSTPNEADYSRSVRWFPLVGLVLAVILSAAYLILRLRFSDLPTCLMLVILLMIFTKGLHLDGLSDTFDALLSGRPREEMLIIMKDHQSGALGTCVLLSVFLLKVFLLSEIFEYLKIPALLLVLTSSRSAVSVLLGNLPYLRKEEGLGFIFQKNLKSRDWIIALVIGMLVAFASFLWIGLIVYFLGILTVWCFGLYVKHRLGGITGDVCGAANEIGEVVFLFWLKVFLV